MKLSCLIYLLVLSSISPVLSQYESTDFTSAVFTGGIEGPAYKDANLFVVNFSKEGSIGMVNDQGKCSMLVELPNGSIGNSIQITEDGDLLIADYVNHNVLKYSFEKDSVSIYAHSDSMNQPNDIVLSVKGYVYASDPNWSDGDGNLWMVDTNGLVSLLESNMGTTNGIVLSPDEKTLYVNESVQRKVWQYDVHNDGTVSNKKLLIEFPDFGMDGMKCDEKGDLYIARYGKGVIAVVSPEGKLLREIKLKGSKPTNLVFGGLDRKQVFVTMQERKLIEMFTNQVAGAK